MQEQTLFARALATAALLLLPIPGIAQAAAFATVGDTVIAREDYEAAVAAGVRQKFYHGRAPEQELLAYRREVGERLIERVLLLGEAERRGLKPDAARIDETVAQYDRRYAASERWRANREQMLPPLVAELGRQSVLEQLERSVRAVPAASAKEARAYYEAHRELFTEPEQARLSLILLRVDPSAPKAAWEQAQAEAARLRERLARGADFAELARLHSSDASAAEGGDLGYLHRGMLPGAVEEKVIDALKPGEVSAPVRVLEGFALVRLTDRKSPRLRGFDESAARAAELAQRSRGEAAWKALLASLRARARISVDESAYQSSAAR